LSPESIFDTGNLVTAWGVVWYFCGDAPKHPNRSQDTIWIALSDARISGTASLYEMLALNRMLLRESESTRPLQELLEKSMLLAGGQRVQPFRMLALTLAISAPPSIKI